MYVFLVILLVLLVPYAIRVAIGPSVWDRLLCMNLITSKLIIIIVIYASIHEMTFLLDFAIIYALMGFIGTIFISLFLSERGIKKGREGKE